MRLLLIACSATKRPDAGLLSAVERYQGTWFKVLHAYQRARPVEVQALAVWILSAEFGLIAANTPIPDYNRTMTPTRRRELAPALQVQWASLRQALASVGVCHVAMGAQYRAAISEAGFLAQAQQYGITVSIGQGGIGEQARQLKDWLYHEEHEL